MTWRLVIPEVPPSGNVIKRMHFRVYMRLMESWFLLVRGAQGFLDVPRATGKRRLTITRHGVRLLDRDNLYASMKPVIDVLRPGKIERGIYKTGKRQGQAWERRRIGHGLIQEDDADHLELHIDQCKLRPGQKAFLVMHLEEAPLTPEGTLET